ncbi:MAG: hypothetical protein PHS48_09550, partial [Bacteroidales bacterium]|nr:hypothetical protein [Bacteroidales bacterium]
MKLSHKKLTFSLFVWVLFLTIHSCTAPEKPDITEQKKSDETADFLNRYKGVLEHYSKPEDSLKLRAANFLIRGLPDQFHYESATLDLYDSLARQQTQPSVSWLQNTLDSLRTFRGMSLEIHLDTGLISNEYLIENIEYAFKAWELPWCKDLNFDQFCEYILPYKSGNEKPERWRKKLWEEYQWVIKALPPDAEASQACKLINDSVEKWYTVNLNYNYPVDIGYTASTWITKGTCYGGSMMILYPLRALGVASTYDYVPRWANRNGDHNWNALYDHGALIAFNGPDRNPGGHKIEFIGVGRMFFKRPKVFRKTYASQNSSLAYKALPDELIPETFESLRIKDVTSEYIPVSNIQIKAPGLKDRFAYLCTFDNANWKPVWWGERKKNTVTFYNM